ncbi:MAG: transcription elongation factor GreA [Actinobacteria bacterium]|nr:transcription elongation factor GreA [Actinomycetota bacterium]
MASNGTRLSRTAHDRLREELEDLESRGRVDIARVIETARELGDLKENADYHAAKDDQGRMEARIRQLQSILEAAEIIDDEAAAGATTVASGTVVTLRYEGEEDTEHYLIGSIEERRADLAVISPASPLGQAVLGRRPGETVAYEAPSGTLRVEIVTIGE